MNTFTKNSRLYNDVSRPSMGMTELSADGAVQVSGGVIPLAVLIFAAGMSSGAGAMLAGLWMAK